MLRNFIIILFHVLIAQVGWSQKTDLSIHIDNKINVDNLHIHYMDGTDIYDFTDSIKDNHLIIRQSLYAPFASVQIGQKDKSVSKTFYINENPAIIWIKGDTSSPSTSLLYDFDEYVVDFYDTLSNPILIQLRANTREIRDARQELWTNHADQLTKDDSLRHLHITLLKQTIESELPILREHGEEYFSFKHFTRQVDYAMYFIKEDPDFYSDLLLYLNSTFPMDFLTSGEGKAYIRNLENKINPVEPNIMAPETPIRLIDGSRLTLLDFKGKYVLLDFWATWCAPCMEQVPTLKKIREELPKDRFELIGVSVDKDSISFVKTIREKEMNWTHVLDRNRELQLLYNVQAYPTMILIDPFGKIVHIKVGGKIDVDRLREIMERN